MALQSDSLRLTWIGFKKLHQVQIPSHMTWVWHHLLHMWQLPLIAHADMHPTRTQTRTLTQLQCVCDVCTCMTNVLFLCCLGRLSSAIYLRAWRCHLLFGQWMVLSGKPPDYTQCGNSNETNSSVAMETRNKIFDTLDLLWRLLFGFCFIC